MREAIKIVSSFGGTRRKKGFSCLSSWGKPMRIVFVAKKDSQEMWERGEKRRE